MSAVRDGAAFSCRDCAADIDHCHGTLIEHRDALAECTDPQCVSLAGDRHRLVTACAELDDCGCAQPEIEYLTAS
ncbi:MAG: hypothetical protein GX542_08220 [Rhodococcus sp.]|nr:hypothetical protein [Rhodococcus sp. (in: high G+C Gram-positive bacteria)]